MFCYNGLSAAITSVFTKILYVMMQKLCIPFFKNYQVE